MRWFGVVRFGSAGFGGRKRAKKIKMFAVVFLWFGLVRRGSVGFGGSKDTGGPSSQEEKPPHVAQHGHKKPILWFNPGGHTGTGSPDAARDAGLKCRVAPGSFEVPGFRIPVVLRCRDFASW